MKNIIIIGLAIALVLNVFQVDYLKKKINTTPNQALQECQSQVVNLNDALVHCRFPNSK